MDWPTQEELVAEAVEVLRERLPDRTDEELWRIAEHEARGVWLRAVVALRAGPSAPASTHG